MFSLPPEITFSALWTEYMSYVAVFVPIGLLFMAWYIGRRMIRGIHR